MCEQVISEDALLLGPASLHMCAPILHAALTAEQPFFPQADKAMAILLKHAHLVAEGIDSDGIAEIVGGQALLPMSSAQALRVTLLEAAVFTCGASPLHPAAPPATFEYGKESDPQTATSTSTLSLPPCFHAVIDLAGQGLPLTQPEWGPLLRDQGLLGPKNAQVGVCGCAFILLEVFINFDVYHYVNALFFLLCLPHIFSSESLAFLFQFLYSWRCSWRAKRAPPTPPRGQTSSHHPILCSSRGSGLRATSGALVRCCCFHKQYVKR